MVNVNRAAIQVDYRICPVYLIICQVLLTKRICQPSLTIRQTNLMGVFMYSCSSKGDEASRRYFFRMLFASIFYCVTVFGVSWLAKTQELATAWLVLLSFLPVIPAALMLFAVVSFVRSRDELHQRIVAESALVSAAVVGLASFTWGFIDAVVDNAPEVSMVWILPALMFVQGAALPIVRRRYL